LSDDNLNHILSIIGHSLASGTQETYGSGLLVFHVFCDAQGVSKEQQGPTSSVLLLVFIANCAGMCSGKTLENYYYGVCVWHLLHGLDWLANQAQVVLALQDGTCLAPVTSKHPKCHPFTIPILLQIRSLLVLSEPLDAAVWACLVTLFFSLVRLGEVMVHSLLAFDSSLHVKVSDIHYAEDRHGLKVTILCFPQMKMSCTGEDLYFAAQSHNFDPNHALRNHLHVNSPASLDALFSWKHHSGQWPLTWSEFLRALDHISQHLQIKPLKGHGVQIRRTLEYLLHGVPFETVKVMGRWSGEAFVKYLRQHAVVMAPYLQ
ncbi:hypothetical protein BDR03DRAFT_805710, partial [Suillus americanus]